VGAEIAVTPAATAGVGAEIAATPALTLAGDVPQISLPAAGLTITAGASTAITGTAAPNSVVEILADGVVIGAATADANGAWNFDIPALEGGVTELSVKTDAGTSAPIPVVVPDVDIPAGGLVLDAAAGELTGQGAPGETVEILIDGQPAGTATVGSDGTWTLELPQLPPGDYAVSVRTAAGESEPVQVTIADGAEQTSTVDEVPAEVAVDSRAGTVSGSAAPTATIEIVANGDVVGTATADAAGKWSLELPVLEPGTYTVTAQTEAGASQPVTVKIETARPVMPTVDVPAAGLSIDAEKGGQIRGTAAPSATVEILAGGEVVGTATADRLGQWTFDVTTFEGGTYEVAARSDVGTSDAVQVEVIAPAPAPVIILPKTGDTIPAGAPPVIRGTAAPNAIVEVFAGDSKLGEAKADRRGNWRFTPSGSFAPGKVAVIVRTLDAAGRSSEASSQIELIVSDAILLPTTGSGTE
jgi:hypothetical protein